MSLESLRIGVTNETILTNIHNRLIKSSAIEIMLSSLQITFRNDKSIDEKNQIYKCLKEEG